MSISTLQFETKKEEVIFDILKKGIEATTYEVALRLSEHFDKYKIGMPYFKPIQINKYDLSNSSTFNKMFKDLAIDLAILYQANKEQYDMLMSIEEFKTNEFDKVESEINKLSLKIESLNEAIGLNKAICTYSQVFNDFYTTEFDCDVSKNLPYTTAFVDLLQKKVYNEKTTEHFNKYNISNAEINIYTNDVTVKTSAYGDRSNILKDTINENYSYTLKSSVNNEKSIVIEINLPYTISANNICLSASSTKDMKGTIKITEDEINYIDLHDISSNQVFEWKFETQYIKKAIITLTKDEADGFDYTSYEYYFLLKNLSITNDSYVKIGSYISKPIEFNESLESITLNSNDNIYPGTNINYFVGMERPNTKINWISVDNNKKLPLDLLKEEYKIKNGETADYGIPKNYNNITGKPITCYTVGKLQNNTNMNSLEIYPGYQMWNVEVLNQNITDKDSYKIVVDGLNYVDPLDTFLVDCDMYKYNISPNNVFIFSQYVYADDEVVLSDRYIKLTDLSGEECKGDIKVLINTIETKKINNKYNIKLRAGRNKVQIIIFGRDVTINGLTTNGNVILNHNINFKDISFNVYAKPKMKQANRSFVINKVWSNLKYYFIQNGYIYTRFKTDNSSSYLTYIDNINNPEITPQQTKYLIKYKYIPLNAASKIEFRNNKPLIKFRVMAQLTSIEENISPEIINFKVVGE